MIDVKPDRGARKLDAPVGQKHKNRVARLRFIAKQQNPRDPFGGLENSIPGFPAISKPPYKPLMVCEVQITF